MRHRRFLSGLLVLALLGAAALLTLQPPDARAQAGAVHYAVDIHGPGRPFHLLGYFSTRAAAERAAHYVREHRHFTTRIRVIRGPLPRITPRRPSGLMPTSITVTPTQARQMFSLMARQSDIDFRYPIDGCYARAELMIERMRQRRLHPYRVWSVAHGEPLYVRTRNVRAGYVQWGYHVAPILRVRLEPSRQQWWVIDPSLFSHPVTIQTWENIQRRTSSSPMPYITLTRVGDAPVWVDGRRKPGTGYWPGADPPQGLHRHAVETMRRYKALEGRVSLPGSLRRFALVSLSPSWDADDSDDGQAPEDLSSDFIK